MCKQAAKEIRTALKNIGINSKKVSVRNKSYSMGSSVNVEIKCPLVDAAKVKEIAESFQQISRCNYTGEILSGGNSYVFVDFSQEVEEYFRDLGELLVSRVEREGHVMINGYQIEKGDYPGELTAWKIDGNTGSRVNASSPAGVARAMHMGR